MSTTSNIDDDELVKQFASVTISTSTVITTTTTENAVVTTETTSTPTITSTANKFQGPNPNVQWRAFTTEDLLSHSRFIPNSEEMPAQRSEQWFEQRKSHITGSQLAKSVGFFSSPSVLRALKLEPRTYHRKGELKELYFNLHADTSDELKETNFTAFQRVFMDWGTYHEPNAILTFLHAFPEYTVQETGFWSSKERTDIHDRIVELIQTHAANEEDNLFVTTHLPDIGASPDGLVINKETNEIVGVLEIKCPTPFIPLFEKDGKFKSYQYRKRKPHDQIPVYYLPQIMVQMFVTDVKQCLFSSWCTTTGMNVLQVKFDPEYMYQIFYWVARFNEQYQKNIASENGDAADEQELMKVFESDNQYMNFVKKSLDIVQNHVPLIQHVSESPHVKTNYLTCHKNTYDAA
jgi:hypothetical protein